MSRVERFGNSGGEIKFAAGTTHMPDGGRVIVDVKNYKANLPEGRGSSVANHEMGHAIVGEVRGSGVRLVTNIENKSAGYRGLTILNSPDPVAAVAPHVDGHEGTGHDLRVLSAMGYRVEDVSGEARRILDNYKDHKRIAAIELDRRRVMTGSDIRDVIKRVDEEKEKEKRLKTAEVFIKKPDGSERKFVLNSLDPYVALSGDLFVANEEKPKAVKLSNNNVPMKPNEWYVLGGRRARVNNENAAGNINKINNRDYKLAA